MRIPCYDFCDLKNATSFPSLPSLQISSCGLPSKNLAAFVYERFSDEVRRLRALFSFRLSLHIMLLEIYKKFDWLISFDTIWKIKRSQDCQMYSPDIISHAKVLIQQFFVLLESVEQSRTDGLLERSRNL